MLVRDYLTAQIQGIFTGLNINSKDIFITDNYGKARNKNNFLFCYLGDENNVFAINDANAESGTSIAYELILEVQASSNQIAIQNEAVEEIKTKILQYRTTSNRVFENDNYRVEIQDIVYNNILTPESANDTVVMLMIQGELIINQILKEA